VLGSLVMATYADPLLKCAFI